MDIVSARCPSCGAPISVSQSNNKILTCVYCSSDILLSNALEYSLNYSEDDQIVNTRLLLEHALSYNDIGEISKYASKILSLIPSDYSANYYYAYASYELNKPQALLDLLTSREIESTDDEIFKICTHMANNIDLREYLSVLDFIESVNPSYLDQAREIIEKRIVIEDQYSETRRDIFICHRSTDLHVVIEIVDALEKDGYTCWYAQRNLRPNDSDNYHININKAIENTDIILVISSRSAMLSKDVQRELVYANNLNKSKLEYKIDKSNHTTLFKQVFNGIKWIDASENNAVDVLKKRVFYLTQTESKQRLYNEAYPTSHENPDSSAKNNPSKAISRKIEIKRLNTISKKEKSIIRLKVIDLKDENNHSFEITPDEEKTLANGLLFLDNKVFDVAKKTLLSIYTIKSSNADLLFALILCDLKINYSIFELPIPNEEFNYSLSLQDHLDHLINILTESDEHKILIQRLGFLLRYSITNLNETEESLKIFTYFFNELIKIKNLEFLSAVIKDFEHELGQKALKLNLNQITQLYYSFRDVLLNVNTQLISPFIYNLLINHSKEGIQHFLDIIEDALDYLPDDGKINQLKLFAETKSNSFNDALFKIISFKKYEYTDDYLSKLKTPEIEILNILKTIRENSLFVNELSIKKIFDYTMYLSKYLPNYSVNLFTEQLTKFGYFLLKYNYFKQARKVFSIVIDIKQSEIAIWGLILAKSRSQDEYQLFRNKIELNDFKEYNVLLNISKDIEFYNQIYLAIKKDNMSLKLKDEISKRWLDYS